MNTKYLLLISSALIFNLGISSAQGRWYEQETLQRGAMVFQKNCASCHKANAEGTLEWKKRDALGVLPPPPLNGTAHAWHHDKEVLKITIQEGGAKLGGTMPAFNDKLSGSDIDAAIAYFQSKWSDELYQDWENRNQDKSVQAILPARDKSGNSLQNKNEMTKLLKMRLGNKKVSQPLETPVENIYLVIFDSKYAYLTQDGRFLFMSSLIDLKLGKNLTSLAKTNTKEATVKAEIANVITAPEFSKMADLFKISLGSNNVSEPVKTPVSGIYQTRFGSNFAYLTRDGRYVFMGKLIDLERGVDLTGAAKRQTVTTELNLFANADKAIFPAMGIEKAVINVFTDTSCSTCKKLFKEVPKLQDAGITVQYMPYPDGGPKGPGYQTLKQVWCAEDKAKALTIGKGMRQGSLPTSDCINASLVDKSYEIGNKVGVVGTPAIFTQQGDQIKGYVPYQKLIPILLKN